MVDTFEFVTGIHMPSVELAMVTGLAPQVSPSAVGGTRFGWFVFPDHHLGAGGCRLEGHEAYRRHPGMRRWNELALNAELPRSITYQALEVPASGVAPLDRLFSEIRVYSVPRAAPAAAPVAAEAPSRDGLDAELPAVRAGVMRCPSLPAGRSTSSSARSA